MLQQIGFAASAFFAILVMVFLMMGIYAGYKNYGQPLPGKGTGVIYFLLAALSMGLSLFMFLTTESGFSWETVLLSVCSIIALSIFLTIADLIKMISSKFLITKDSLSPLGEFIKLFNFITKKSFDGQDSGVDDTHED